MKIRSLALILAAGFALTAVAEAKKKPAYNYKAAKTHKTAVHKIKVSKHRVSKATVRRRKHTA
jgi:hypothetical protein